jgi:drug/metabolite transporter (DMT)-like permease
MNIFLYFVAIISLSQSANWVKWAHADVEVFGFWRLFLAFLIILTFSNLKRSPKVEPSSKAPSSFLFPFQKAEVWMAILSGVFFFAHLWTYKYAALNTRIANCMILFAMNPLFTALVTLIFMKGKISGKIILSYILAMLGIWQLVSHQLQFEPTTLKGDLVAILSAGLYSAYILSGQKARSHMNNSKFTLILFSVAALCFLITGWGRSIEMWPQNTQTWIAIFGLCIFSTLLGHGLFVYLVKYLDINWMSSGKLIEPILAAIAAYFLFSEEISRGGMIAFVFTAASLFLLIWGRPKNVG